MRDKIEQFRRSLPPMPPGGVPAIGLPPGMRQQQAPPPPEEIMRNVREQAAFSIFHKVAEALAAEKGEPDLQTKEDSPPATTDEEAMAQLQTRARAIVERCFIIADVWTCVAQHWRHDAPIWVHPRVKGEEAKP